MSTGREWDIALTKKPSNGHKQLTITIPVALAKPLMAAGMNRASLRITEDGILVTPYIAEDQKRQTPVTLPDWGNK